MKEEKPFVSILVCSKDRHKDLERLAEHLKGLTSVYPFEIVIVEETNHPAPIEGTRYISHPVANRGIPYARNLALAGATGELIVFLDDDCLICEGWLDRLLEPFRDNSIVAVQGGVSVPENSNAVGWAETLLGVPGGGFRRVLQAHDRLQETREVSTLNCAYRRSVIDKIGGFEKQLKITGEDYLLAKQACSYGKCLFIPAALVHHTPRGNLINIWHWFHRRGRAEVAVIRTGKQKDMGYGTLIRSSLLIKIFLLILLGTLSLDLFVFWVLAALGAYALVQYCRYFKPWRLSRASGYALMILPLVKLTMDVAIDSGRGRGLIFD